MYFGQIRLLALTLPTVAAFTVISILWFRHHQKKRRPPVDLKFESSVRNSLEIFTDESDTRSDIVQIPEEQDKSSIAKAPECTSPCLPFVSIKEVEISTDTSEEGNKKLQVDVILMEDKNLIIQPVDKITSIKEVASLIVDSTVEDSKTSIELHSIERSKTNMQKEAIVCKTPEKKANKSVEDLDSSSDLEEGEIRSPLLSSKQTTDGTVSKQDSEDRDSVFADDFEDSSKGCKIDVVAATEEIESDLEEGEIRSTDGRTEETMKKEKEELTEKLASLELNQMTKNSTDSKALPSLELDQMKLDDAKSGSERDSANHSPSEVMLASPSISTFSDAHSEGSSDSGKGQSDAATSPSRTPAGGSSLAGDQAPSVYEFVLPQVIVGRLIGRHGTFLHEIKTQTHTNIFIKRHPDSIKLKICAIEGTQQDIDRALTKIRHKFPLRRFPQLTLEKVSFVQVSPVTPPLKPEDFHLPLIEGVNNDVILSSLISAAHFFLQQPCHPSYASLGALNAIMSQLYSSSEAPVLDTPINYAICAAPAMGGWYRAQIVHIEEETQVCTVRYLDYGGYSRIPSTNLKQIRGDLLALPFQAVECYLANVAPPPGAEGWSEEARLFVQNLTCGQVLQAQVYDYFEDGSPLVYLYSKLGNQVVLINEELVLHGFAVIVDPSASSCPSVSGDLGTTEDELDRTEKSSFRPQIETQVLS